VLAAEVGLEAGRRRTAGSPGQRGGLTARGGGGAQRGLVGGLARQPRLVRALVARLEAQIADDDLVQRADRLAEAQRIDQLAVERDRQARDVGGEAQAGAAGQVAQPRAAVVAEVDPHRITSALTDSVGRWTRARAARAGSRWSARASAVSAAARSGARTLCSASASIGSS
jgi:hypothetical protein